MTEQPQHLTIFRSSAGSGKTFTLVKEYLRIVLPKPWLYRHVLAVTFTNKATEEMKSRILEKLFQLSRADEQELASIQEYQLIREELASQQEHPDQWVPDRARHILRSILGDYGHFSVSTIESFFQKILRAFARELDIPLGYEVEMRQDLVLLRLIEALAAQIDLEPRLHKLLTNYLLQQLEEEKGWDVFRELSSLGKEVFKETFVGQVRQHMDEVDDILELADRISEKAWKRRRQFEHHLIGLAKQAKELMAAHDISKAEFKWANASVPGYFDKVLNKDFELKARTLKGYDSFDEWLPNQKKEPVKFARVEAVLQAGLWDLLRDMVDFTRKKEAEYFTDVLLTQTASTFGLLGYLEKLLNDYRHENRLLLISDTSRLLTQVIRESDPPFVYEKAGHYYEHFLLDEFQDTSNLQWENFWPLIEESLGYGRFNLLVGDIKQAIYRWRNGNPQLMVAIEQQHADVVDARSLKDNWRTAHGIVTFNNHLFQLANEAVRLQLSAANPRGYAAVLLDFLGAAYLDVAQNPRKTAYEGYVEVQLTEQERSRQPFVDAGLNHLLQWVKDCREAGFQYRDMAVLVRKNADGVAAARQLMSHPIEVNGVEEAISVSSAESLLLESHPQVRWLIASLNYFLQPEDPVTMANWWDLEHLLRFGQEHQASFEGLRGEAIRLRGHLGELRGQPLYELVESLVALLPDTISTNNAYVLGFLDAVWEYSSKYDTSLSGFMEWWKDQRSKKSVQGAETDNAVQVMTIHKSKGLEFPIVLLPFVDWGMGISGNNISWVETKDTAYEEDFPILPVYLNGTMEKSLFAPAWQEENILSHLDSLNMLYVALTRPKYRLYLHGASRKNTDKDVTETGHLLQHVFTQSWPEGLNQLETGWTFGKADPAPRKDAESSGDSRMVAVDLATYEPPATRAQPLIHIRSSEFLERTEEGRESIVEGLVIHEALSRIITADELPVAIRDLTMNGMIRKDQAEMYEARLQRLLNFAPAKSWFEQGWEVKTEAGILEPSGHIRRPDRVLVKGDQALVIDFKTGAERPSHRKQVLGYMHLLKELGYPNISGWLYYTGKMEVVEV